VENNASMNIIALAGYAKTSTADGNITQL